jgi:hypothetical protein
MRLAAKSDLRGAAPTSALPRFDDIRASDFISNLLIGMANDTADTELKRMNAFIYGGNCWPPTVAAAAKSSL